LTESTTAEVAAAAETIKRESVLREPQLTPRFVFDRFSEGDVKRSA
jgi:hypothetical protein